MAGALPHPPELVVFDVNETLSDTTPLRDGFALTTTGAYVSFSAVQEAALRHLLGSVELGAPAAEARAEIMRVFTTLEPHPDVAEGMRRLAEAGSGRPR